MEKIFSNLSKKILSRSRFISSLLENYEAIFDINISTNAYKCLYLSHIFDSNLDISDGHDFFIDMASYIVDIAYYLDRDYVTNMMRKVSILNGLKNNKSYSFICRLVLNNKPLYHKIKFVEDYYDGQSHIIFSIKNINFSSSVKNNHYKELSFMQQKERNNMKAILDNAIGYLEINLTNNYIMEMSSAIERIIYDYEIIKDYSILGSSFDYLEQLFCDEYVKGNKESYIKVCNSKYLISQFYNGERRITLNFSSLFTRYEEFSYCQKNFYIYQDTISKDILCFCVIYDITNNQMQDYEIERLEIELKMSQIKNFTHQMHLHFLYNTLASIQEIVLDNPQYAYELIEDFTTYLRNNIQSITNDNPIPFYKEIDNIKAYTNIEKMRFGDKLNIKWNIKCDKFYILPLTIQPIVENSIKHGIYNRGPVGGTVNISSYEKKDSYIIEIEDDGIGFDISKVKEEITYGNKESAGIINLLFRLEKVMGAKVEIKSTVNVGTKVVIRLPKRGN